MKNSRAFDLVVFDMDGTLLDSMGCLEDWIYRAVKAHSAPGLTPADITAAFGPTEKEIISRFVPAEFAQACLEDYYTIYEQEHVLRVSVYPEMDFLLNELRRAKFPTALCTGKSRRAVEISLHQLGWYDVFQTIITGDDTRKFKPDPEGLNLILAKTKAARDRAIFIGDSPADLAAARSAGLKSGHALWGAPGTPLPPGVAANFSLRTPQAVLPLLKLK